MLNLPTGWFCILFPDDIRELLIGDESTVICNWVAMHLHRSIFGHSVLIPKCYDIVLCVCGPAGYVAAIASARLGIRTVLRNI